MTTSNAPLIYLSDDSMIVRTVVRFQLETAGFEIYEPASANNPDNPTSFMGNFACALLDLDATDGKDDPIDTAELLRVYQPTLPVAFLHEAASDKLVKRAATLASTFKKPDDLQRLLAWVLECAKA